MEKMHPEMLPGERFLTNTYEDEYRKISYKTKRMGKIAYAKSGYVIEGVFPVFVQKDEYNSRMDEIARRKHLDNTRRRSH